MEQQPGVPPSSTSDLAKKRRPWKWVSGGLLLGALLFITGYFLFRDTARDGAAQEIDPKAPVFPTFVGWDKPRPPDLAIVISGQTHGYLQPCGCSYPQKGGL